MANLKTTMFREYDLRGRVNEEELNASSVDTITRAYGTMLRNRGIKDVIIGHDLRSNSRELTNVAINSLKSTGLNVIFLGQILTPMMYSAQYFYNSKGGVMVTASHNPNGWLGFKFALGFSSTLRPQEMEELRLLTISEDFIQEEGNVRIEDYLSVYTRDLLSRVNISRPVKVLINAGNGTAGPIVPEILRDAGCEVFEFLTIPDLEFKHYFPNPALEKMMLDTGEYTRRYGAEIGFAIDGDGDRLGITDELGNIIWPDRYLILLSRAVLHLYPGSPIVFDVKCSKALVEDIREHNGTPIMWKTGHSYIKEKLNELDAPLAGEMSGHIFFGKPIYHGFDDAVFTALKMLELLSTSETSLSNLIAETPNYISTPSLQAYCSDESKYHIVESVVKSFISEGFEALMFDEDPRLGGRIEFEAGWGLIRASSNLPTLILRFEAEDQSYLDDIQEQFRKKLESYPEVSRQWESG